VLFPTKELRIWQSCKMADAPLRATRITRQGQAVLSAVDGSENFRSAQDIHAQLRAAGETVGLTTVYRHLALLTEDGQLDALQTAEGELVYRRCHSSQHHHHVVCRQCRRGIEVELPDLEQWAESTAHALGYTDISHTVEIFGLCSSCRLAKEGAQP
jgi:Fur family transcriptional regulator, ferric uptake regulator